MSSSDIKDTVMASAPLGNMLIQSWVPVRDNQGEIMSGEKPRSRHGFLTPHKPRVFVLLGDAVHTFRTMGAPPPPHAAVYLRDTAVGGGSTVIRTDADAERRSTRAV